MSSALLGGIRCTDSGLGATFALEAPSPTRCGDGQPCAAITVEPSAAAAGDVVHIKGWAPLTGRWEFGGEGYMPVLFPVGTPLPTGRPDLVVITPAKTALRVTPSPTWAEVSQSPPVSIQEGDTTFATDPRDGSRLAYCSEGIHYSEDGASTWTSIPVDGAVAAAPEHYPVSHPSCGWLALDPDYPSTFYASFHVSHDGERVPSYPLGFVTSDRGATWRLIPWPDGASVTSFAGFARTSQGSRRCMCRVATR